MKKITAMELEKAIEIWHQRSVSLFSVVFDDKYTDAKKKRAMKLIFELSYQIAMARLAMIQKYHKFPKGGISNTPALSDDDREYFIGEIKKHSK